MAMVTIFCEIASVKNPKSIASVFLIMPKQSVGSGKWLRQRHGPRLYVTPKSEKIEKKYGQAVASAALSDTSL